MEIIYRAPDGTDFTSREACEKYELEKYKDEIHLYSKDFEPLALNHDYLEFVVYCYCETDEAAVALHDFYEADLTWVSPYHEFKQPTAGIYYYSNNCNKFLKLEDEMTRLNNIKERMCVGQKH
jgi:hypothetical protein